MIIDKINKVIFLEIPKTGTSFFRHHLRGYNSDDFIVSQDTIRHAGIRHTRDYFDLDVNDYKIFLNTRHPEDWLSSEFSEYTTNHLPYYLKGYGTYETKKHIGYRHSFFKHKDPYDFNVHLDMLLTDDNFKIPGQQVTITGSIYKPFLLIDQELKHVNVLKYEDFQNTVKTVFNAMDKPVPDYTKVVHKTQTKKQRPNRKNRSRINRIFDADFKEFGYQKRTVMALND